MNLLSIGNDSKTVKGEKLGYLTGVQYLAPSNVSGVINTCPNASNGCREACLFTAGRAGVFKMINEARINRTVLFTNDITAYFDTLTKNITALINKATKNNLVPTVRLNGTSDIAWENYKRLDGKNVFEAFPHIQFYDYTKSFKRMMVYLNGKMPSNYHLTFSRSESNDAQCIEVLKNGGNVAVVFEKTLPSNYLGYNVVNGDLSDLRFSDEKNVIVGLKSKGKARNDTSGFMVAA